MSPAHRVRDDGNVRYYTAHQRMGMASEHECPCGAQAYEWCYLGGDPDELVDDGLAYSLDRSLYQAMCRSCHRKHDHERRHGPLCQRGHDNWRVRKDGRRICRTCHYEASRRSLERSTT